MSQRPAPLTGIRVLDLTRVLAGPWCTQNLADLGAEVIKIERPGSGDDTRAWGPPYLKDEAGNDTSEAAYYLSANRNKLSVALDIASPRGAELVRELALQSDILVENFKVGGLSKYGLDYDSLKEINPRLIYCSITGFGQTGPYASRPGYDFMIQGMGGLMSITGERDDLPGGGPQKAGVAVADLMTGMYSTVGILAALHERSRSGVGQHIDMALLDCQVAMLANQNLNFMTSGSAPKRAGNAHQNLVPYQVFAASDGHLIVAVGNDSQFRNYCGAIGLPELSADPRFSTNPQRVKNREELVPLLAERMATGERDHWLAALEGVGVPAGPINTLDQVYEDPHVLARGMKRELPHPAAGKVPMAASPLKFSGSPVEYRRPPPMLGEHTGQVLSERLGLSAEEIQALAQSRS
ncbi:CoA transferase [Achromobacter denitrificans]|jgi:crotonobetainyl-CoA:carnitine CoA-transferase CaiB-like acyl-CoA transferase|uniref:CaiB/BaiF CoA-transferase family protein n=1 Tax=Achromobacter denitrificans TaxID=32002 RepID=A0A3R9G106_ACHDE|nr:MULTISPECIES: CaiB/BaiF CoA-transferase family protein [Achromobacter]ASC64294.1 CoA transferase [Achromobacter denitrificans]MDF3851172.1 CaiB/BaiF CoA-transferase family protein [Achromobacter denitrificans]MDF3858413.1 CaiB/BaiF CoA-transferase family protein [Achromobacter denitrificans]MDF3943981.1 CaiB/BaiF CoA-transferase family protein [Achromobacter denitrificans]MDX3879744.1 CaiB/BaiF CoA-transferase family protein [Achromobacter sp.]